MSIIDKIKRLFSRKKEMNIISISDVIKIPGRDYFKDKPEGLELTDKVKDDYFTKLNRIRRITIKDISSEELINKEKTIVDRLLNMIMREDNFSNESMRLIDYRVILLKLKLCLEDIVKIEDEIIARLIALSELDRERKIPLLNRGTLKAEINSLKISLYTLFSQKSSVLMEIDNYLTHISISDNELKISDVKMRKEKMVRWASHFFNVTDFYREEDLNSEDIYILLSIIALLEIKIEEFLYNNKPDINRLIKECNDLEVVPNMDYEQAKKIKKTLLDSLSVLEDKCMLYDYFCRNSVSEECWKALYSAKFRLLTFDIAENNDDVEKDLMVNSNSRERKIYYENIVQKRSDVLLGNTGITKIIKEDNYESYVKIRDLLTKYLKQDGHRYWAYGDEDYHHSLEAIRFILALDNLRDFNNLLDRKVRISYIDHHECLEGLEYMRGVDRTFVFDKFIPLKTVIEVMSDEKPYLYFKCLKDIYYNICDEKEAYFCLPEGIQIIEGGFHPFDDFGRRLFNKAKGKTVKFPSSLREVYTFVDGVNGTILNDGLEVIGEDAEIISLRGIQEIPSSLRQYGKGGISYNGTYAIRFLDYTNSPIIFNSYKLAEFLSDILTCTTIRTKTYEKDSMNIRIRADVQVESDIWYIILESRGKDLITIDLRDIKCYGTLNNLGHKDTSYQVTDKLALKYAEELLKKIYLERKKLSSNNKKLVK